jgi:hypothetical protein
MLALIGVTFTQIVTLILNEKKSLLHLSACRHPYVRAVVKFT